MLVSIPRIISDDLTVPPYQGIFFSAVENNMHEYLSRDNPLFVNTDVMYKPVNGVSAVQFTMIDVTSKM